MFRRLLGLVSFTASWRQANITTIPKTPPSSSIANYLPISIISVLSKVFERLVSVRPGQFMERCGVIDHWKGLCTCDALLRVSHTFKNALESGREARIEQIDFSVDCEWINHQIILYTSSTLWAD